MGMSSNRFSLQGLETFNKAWCNRVIQSYNHHPRGWQMAQSGRDVIMGRAMVFTVTLMSMLGCALAFATLMRIFVGRHTFHLRLCVGRYNLYPIMAVLLKFAMVLFLPLLTSAFSHTEGHGQERKLLLMIMWMLVVELIRKKVEAMVLPADGSAFARGIGRFAPMSYTEEAARIVWIGYLIYSNMAGQRPVVVATFATLWSLSVAKLLLRALSTWHASRSWRTAKNPLLIAGYMQHVLDKEGEGEASAAAAAAMDGCKYAVMGEETLLPDKDETERQKRRAEEAPSKLALASTLAYGYGVGRRLCRHHHNAYHDHNVHALCCDQSEQKQVHLLLIDDPDKKKDSQLVTVGDIWKLGNHETKPFGGQRSRCIAEKLCLSFALFKMLRRRFEHYPMVEVGSDMARKLMLQGLLALGEGSNSNNPARPLEVLQLELDFVEKYYQSAIPVAVSQHTLFISNICFSALFAMTYLAITILLIQNGFPYLYCVAMGWASSHRDFPALYFFITVLLVATLCFIEYIELALCMFSNWGMVRLLCFYSCARSGSMKQLSRLLILVRIWIFIALQSLAHFFLSQAHTDMTINQVSVLNACGEIDKFSARASHSQVTLNVQAKKDIVQCLKTIDPETGTVGLPPLRGLDIHGKTSTEIVMACHLATELLKIGDQHVKGPKALLAIALSRYCMYLAAHTPELLPDDEAWVSDRYEDMRSCLTQATEQPCGIMCTPSRYCRVEILEKIDALEEEDLPDPTTRDGMRLFRELKQEVVAEEGRAVAVWQDLAEFWIKLLIYLAPSNDVQGHAKAVSSFGGDLINCLWAFCTHAGITREPLDERSAGEQNV